MVTTDELLHSHIVTDGKKLAFVSVETESDFVRNNRTVVNNPNDDFTGTEWSNWGTTNNYPMEIVDAVAASGALSSAIQGKIDSHIAKGLMVYTEDAKDGKVYDRKIIEKPEIEDFFGYSNIEEFISGVADDHWMHFNYFPELIPNKKANAIAAIKRRDPVYCRWEKMDAKNRIHHLYFSYNWAMGTGTGKKDVAKIGALDPMFPLADLQDVELGGGRTYVLPVRYTTRGKIYYNQCYWHGIKDGWLKISRNIPAAIVALLKNQMIVKWHIQISYNYWTKKYKDWANMSDAERDEKVAATLSKMNDFLTDVDNYGKAWVSFFTQDALDKRAVEEDIKITPLDNKLQDLKYITEFQRSANGEQLFAVGWDGTLYGQNSPGGSEGGSGSNKREAMWIQQQLLNPHRTKTTAPWWRVIAEFNGWNKKYGGGKKLQLGFREIDTSQTLDEGPKKPVEKLS